ncbi:MAG: hypothetical protein PHH16_04615 [Candidatus Gracilibacteria bacterium]|nr:hypothetical protein [Candidatus Gracilibacteria bacterium]
MSKEQNPSYVMDEEIPHSEKQRNNHPEYNSGEVLKSFHHNVSHLDEMIKKVNDIEKNAVKNTDTLNILNTLLRRSGIGGTNGGKESKAYFAKHGEHIVLVLNTVVNGEKLSSIGDIGKILTKVDELLMINPMNTGMTKERRELPGEEKIQRANRRLAQYESQIGEINSAYRENTNDLLMATDWAIDMTGGKSGKKIYEDSLQSLQKNIEKDYKSLLASFAGKKLSEEDAKKLALYRKRAEGLLGKKLEDVQSFVGYLATEKKLDSAIYAGYAIKGMAEGAIDAFIGTAVFAYIYSTNPDVRDSIHSSIGSFYDYLKENHSNYDKLWKDFLKALHKELEKVQKLPQEQQAEAIGKITGNLMATIIGAKGMSTLMKSGKLRLKFKAAETPKKFKAAAEEVKNPTKSKLRKRTKNTDGTPETKAPVKTITDIGEVKSWADLESFMSTVDRVRFKEGLTGKVLQEMIDEARQGTRKIKDIPEYGGIRKTVDKLIKNADFIPEAQGMEKVAQTAKKAIEKGAEKIQDALPFKDAQKFLHKKILTGYDHIDIGITKLRTLTNEKILLGMNGVAKIAHIKEIKELTIKTIESIKLVSFPGKEALLKNLETLSSSLGKMKEQFWELDEWVSHKTSSRLTKREFQALRFEEGFAVREIEKDGKTFYEYRDSEGKKIFEEYTYASHFKDGKAAVTKMVDGKEKNFFIDRKGELIAEHTEASFASIQRFGNGGHRIFNGEFYQIRYPKSHKTNKNSQYYTFMTEIRSDMVIAVDKSQGMKYIINQNGKRFKTPFHYIDDFAEQGVAAVQEKPNGRWLLIDKKGNLLKRDGNILRKNEDIITKNGDGKLVDGKGRPRTQAEKDLQEKEFESEGSDTNLEAIKTHLETIKIKEDALFNANNPEMVRKRREVDTRALSEILQKNGIRPSESLAFQYTGKEGILLYSNPNTKGIQIVNLEKKTISEKSFSYIHTPDIENGFIRVHPLDDKKHMGVVDMNGEYTLQPKYSDIQVHDEKKILFKVSEMRKIGEKLKDGTVIKEHFSDPPGAQVVERIGLADGKGNVIIETGWTEITQSNDIMAQGFIRGENHEILRTSKKYNIEKYSKETTNTGSRGSDITSMAVVATVEGPAVAKKSGRGSLNIVRNETSTVVSELKNSELSLYVGGAAMANESLPPQMQIFLQKKVPLIRDVGTLNEEVQKMVHEETSESVRKYLEKNMFSELTRTERVAVADYEKETRERLMRAVREQVRTEQTIPRRESNEGGAFTHALVNNLHPDLYVSLGGAVRKERTFKKAA